MPKLPLSIMLLFGSVSDQENAAPAAGPVAADSLGDPLPPGARLRLGTTRLQAASAVADLALSPDGATLVSAGEALIAWDTATGKERWRAKGAQPGYRAPAAAYGVRALAFSNDGAHFVTPGRGNNVLIWETATGHCEDVPIASPKAILGMEREEARSVDVTPDGKKLAIGGAHGVVVCGPRGKLLYELANHVDGPAKFDNNDRLTFFGHYSLARFSPDGKALAVVTSDRPEQIQLHDAETGRELGKLELASRLVRLAFSPDGRQIAATERDSAVRLYDVATGKRTWSHVVKLSNPHENYTSALEFSPDGNTLAVCATDNRIYLLDPATGEETGRLVGHHWYPWALAFTADGKTLFSSGWEGVIRRWAVAGRTQLGPPAGIHGTAAAGASRDGRTVAYVDDSGTIRLVNAEDGKERRAFALPNAQFSQVVFSPDARNVAGGGSIGDQVLVAVWDIESGRLLQRWEWPKGKDPHSDVDALEYSPDGSRLAAAVFRQSTAYLLEPSTGRQVTQMGHTNVYGLSFSPGGKRLVTAGWDSRVRFWDAESGALQEAVDIRERVKFQDKRMYTVCCAPDEAVIATAHLDGNVVVWDTGTMQPHSQFQTPIRFSFGALRYSPDGLWLATGNSVGGVEIVDPWNGQVVWRTGRHGDHVYTLDFCGGSRSLISGGGDGVCYVWDLRPPGTRPDAPGDQLWHDLVGEDAKAAYRAMWSLADTPDRTIPLLKERTGAASLVVDLNRLAAGKSDEERERLKRIRALLAKPDSKVVLAVGLKRAVSVLEQIGTAKAIEVLEGLAERDARDEVKRSAAAALRRLKLAGKP